MGATASNKKFGKARNGTGKRYSEGFLGFVDLTLSEHDKQVLADYVTLDPATNIDIAGFICALAENGYKFSLVTDHEHHSSIATATGKHESNPNNGYALSARGPDPLAAIIVLWYKIVHMCDWERWTEHGGENPEQLSLFR